jgi:ribosomal protein S18 acetylase RimI-like enzyme
MRIEVRRIHAGEAERLRELRLRALREDPAAFAASFASVDGEGARYWEDWAARGAAGETHVTIVAVEDRRWLGMVGGRLLNDRPGSAWLEALWVEPSARRAGLGLRLMDAIAAWSRERGAAKLELSVTVGNDAAWGIYTRAGFEETGRRRPLPADPTRTEVFLSRPL